MSTWNGYLSIIQLAYTGFSGAALGRVLAKKPFAQWLAANFSFNYYIPPSDEELRALVRSSPGAASTSSGGRGSPGGSDGGGGGRKAKQRRKQQPSQPASEADFRIPASSLGNLRLRRAKLTALDFQLFFNQGDLEWLIDLSTMTFFNFVAHEIFLTLLGDQDTINVSQMWLGLVIAFCMVNLGRLARSYLLGNNPNEATICILSFLIFTFIGMLVQVVREDTLEFGMETAYISFNETATAYLEAQTNIDDVEFTLRPVPFAYIKLALTFMCGSTALFLTFPAFRYAQMHCTLRADPATSWQLRHLTVFTFVSPLIIALLWVKPLSRDLWLTIFDAPDSTFESNRIWFIVIVNFVKFSAIMHYSNAYLKTAEVRLQKIRRRGGHTTNKEIQQTFTSVYAYINVVLIQYLGPIMLSFALVFMYKSLGGIHWLPPNWHPSNLEIKYAFPPDAQSSHRTFFASADLVLPKYNFVHNTTAQDEFITTIKGKFNQTLFQCILGFFIWWMNLVWFLASSAGIVFHTFFLN